MNLYSIKTLSISLLLGGLLFGCQSEVKKEGANDKVKDTPSIVEKPNIILIVTDDQGHGDLGYHDNPDIITPNLDQLAKESIRLTNFHVSPVCSPTRASIMTGRYSIRTGIWDTYYGGSIMASEETTLAEILQDNGYATGLFGKWHLGDNYPYRPQDQGFDEVLMHGAGGMGQSGDHPYNFHRRDSSYFDPYLYHNGEASKYEGYVTDIFTDAAIDFIESNKEKPFFTYLAYNAPHSPLMAPKKYVDMYDSLDFDISKYPSDGVSLEPLKPGHKESAKLVYAMISNIDDNVKRLRDRLEALGIADNTILIFMSDNGPQQYRFNSGLRERKTSIHQGGVLTPFFFHYPALGKQPKDIHTPTAHIDILPTLAQLTGATLKSEFPLDGQSLVPLLENNDDATFKGRHLYFEWQRGFPQAYQQTAVRNDDFKLVSRDCNGDDMACYKLYDMRNDPKETINLIDSFPEVAKALEDSMLRWYESVIASPNFREFSIHVGTVHEPETELTRQDCKGAIDQNYYADRGRAAAWAIDVKKEGDYDVEIEMYKNFEKEGKLIVRSGRTQKRIVNWDKGVNKLTIPNVYLAAGKQTLEAWYMSWGKVYTPHYVRLEQSTKK